MEFDRDEAVLAAMNEFWLRGFERVSISDLADVMAIQRSSFYNSFGDRETVFRAALDAYCAVTPDSALPKIAPGQAVKPAIRKVLREVCRARASDPQGRGCLVVNSIGELVGVNEDLGEIIREAVCDRVRLFERLLRQAIDNGEIEPPRDLKSTARAFAAFLAGLNTISKVIRGEDELWGMCEAFLDGVGFGAQGARGARRRDQES